MSMRRFAVTCIAPALALGLLATAAPVLAQATHIIVPPDKVQWGPAPPVLPAGAQMSVLEGNPAEKGPVTLRLKMPANYTIPAHWHTMAERLTILSGTFNVGMGDELDQASADAGAGRIRPAAGDHASLRVGDDAGGRADQSGRAVRYLLRQSARGSAEAAVEAIGRRDTEGDWCRPGVRHGSSAFGSRPNAPATFRVAGIDRSG